MRYYKSKSRALQNKSEQGWVHLAHDTCVEMLQPPACRRSNTISVQTESKGNRCFLLQAKDSESMEQWVLALLHAVKSLREKRLHLRERRTRSRSIILKES